MNESLLCCEGGKLFAFEWQSIIGEEVSYSSFYSQDVFVLGNNSGCPECLSFKEEWVFAEIFTNCLPFHSEEI